MVLGGYAVFDLRVAWRPDSQWQVEARLANALDRTVEPVRDYRGLGLSLEDLELCFFARSCNCHD